MTRSKVQGIQQLRTRIASMKRESVEEIRKALITSAENVQRVAKGLAPRDSGDLANSIRVVPGAHDLQVRIVAGDRQVYYAQWVEFGRQDGSTSPQPFLMPAYRSELRRSKGRISRAITAAAKKAIR